MYRILWMAGVAIVIAGIAVGTYFYLQYRPSPAADFSFQEEEDVYSPEAQARQLKNLKALAATMISERVQEQAQQQAQLAALKALRPESTSSQQTQLKSLQSQGI